MTEKHLFVVLTNAVDGKDDAFNDWYTNRHLADVVAIPGIISARRFELSEAQRMTNPPYRYCALYEIETDDLQGVVDELVKRSGTSGMPLSEAMATERLAMIFKPLGDPLVEMERD